MNADANKTGSNRAVHKLSMTNRETMEVCGVTDVISFDEQTVLLSTVCGNLEIGGSALHIHVLSMEEGLVSMDGKIDSVTYYDVQSDDKSSGNGFFSKIFR